GRSNRTLWTVSTPAPSCRWARNNPSQRCAKRSQNSRSFLSCASAASFLHCCTWSWKKSDVSIIATTTTKAPLTGAPTDQKRTGPVFVPKEKAAYCGRPRRFLEISKLAACSCANCGTQATLTYAALAALLQSLNPKPPPSSTGDQRRARRIAARRHGFRNIQFPCGRRQDPHRLPLINHTSLWLGAWTPTLRIRTARSAACRCNCDAQLQSTIWVLSFPASTADGAVSS